MSDASMQLSSELFGPLYTQLNDAIYLVDPESAAVLDVNEAGCRDLGMQREEVLQETLLSLHVPAIDLWKWHKIVRETQYNGDYLLSGYHRHKYGNELPVEIRLCHVAVEAGYCFVALVRNISKRDLPSARFDLDEEVAQFALKEASDGLWDWDLLEEHFYFSAQWYQIMGYRSDRIEANTQFWMDIIHPDDRTEVLARMTALIEFQIDRFEMTYRLKNAQEKYLWVEDRGRVIQKDEHGRALRVVGMITDITERKALAEQLEYCRQHDRLTGLINRSTGYQLISQRLTFLQQAFEPGLDAFVLLDLDRFSLINDQYGVVIGDQAIAHSARVLQSQLRDQDSLYRWDGKAFLLHMPMTGAEQAEQLVEQLLSWLQDAPLLTLQLDQVQLSCSAGVVIYPGHAASLDAVLSTAAQTLMIAKEMGRNCCCIAPEIGGKV